MPASNSSDGADGMTKGPSKDDAGDGGDRPRREQTVEEKILRMLKRVLTDIAKDTSTPPGMKHPLSENTIQSIRECLGLISAREKELAEESGRPSQSRPEFIDEPKTTQVVTLSTGRLQDGGGRPRREQAVEKTGRRQAALSNCRVSRDDTHPRCNDSNPPRNTTTPKPR